MTGLPHPEQATNYWHCERAPDATVLAHVGASAHGPTPLHEALTGRRITEFTREKPWSLSHDGLLLAAGDAEVRVIETASGKTLAALLRGHRGSAAVVALSLDGRTLATGGADSTILLWDCDAACGLTPAREGTPAELWQDLAVTDPRVAYRASGCLLAQPKVALRLFQENLREVREADTEPIRRRLRELEDRRFAVRQRATQELEQTPAEWAFLLRQALMAGPDLELRRRLEAVREVASVNAYSAETVRSLRAVAVLERIGDPEARALLRRLAVGLPDAPLTQQAQAALRRLAEQGRKP